MPSKTIETAAAEPTDTSTPNPSTVDENPSLQDGLDLEELKQRLHLTQKMLREKTAALADYQEKLQALKDKEMSELERANLKLREYEERVRSQDAYLSRHKKENAVVQHLLETKAAARAAVICKLIDYDDIDIIDNQVTGVAQAVAQIQRQAPELFAPRATSSFETPQKPSEKTTVTSPSLSAVESCWEVFRTSLLTKRNQ